MLIFYEFSLGFPTFDDVQHENFLQMSDSNFMTTIHNNSRKKISPSDIFTYSFCEFSIHFQTFDDDRKIFHKLWLKFYDNVKEIFWVWYFEHLHFMSFLLVETFYDM